MVVVRTEQTSDATAIHVVHVASFPNESEARVVRLLRENGQLLVSMVAEIGGVVVGHVAFSPVKVASGETGVGLAPVAVNAHYRKRGIAAELITAGLTAGRASGFVWGVVLGEPAYYSRFGFVPASEFGLSDEKA